MTNDVIVVNVAENYKLLTVQLMIGYMWVHEKCPGAKYVLKVDDDTYAYLGTVEHIIRRTEERNTVKVNLFTTNTDKILKDAIIVFLVLRKFKTNVFCGIRMSF